MASIRKKKGSKAQWFSRGEEAASKARAQAAATFKPEFWLTSGESARVIFLDRESFNVHLHQLKIRGRLRKYTCLRKNCPLCKINEPRLFSVYRIIDLRKFDKKGSDGKKTGAKTEYKEKYYEVGARMQTTVARNMNKKRLYKKVAEITRDGEGTATTYQLTPIGPISEKLRARILKLLTPKLDPMKDYAPKTAAELKELSGVFDVEDDEEENLRDETHRRTGRSYLEDEDEDDEKDTAEDDDSDDEDDDDDDEQDDADDSDEEDDDEDEDDEEDDDDE